MCSLGLLSSSFDACANGGVKQAVFNPKLRDSGVSAIEPHLGFQAGVAALAATMTHKVIIMRLNAIMKLSRLDGVGMMEVCVQTATNGTVAFACAVAVKSMTTPLMA